LAGGGVEVVTAAAASDVGPGTLADLGSEVFEGELALTRGVASSGVAEA